MMGRDMLEMLKSPASMRPLSTVNLSSNGVKRSKKALKSMWSKKLQFPHPRTLHVSDKEDY